MCNRVGGRGQHWVYPGQESSPQKEVSLGEGGGRRSQAKASLSMPLTAGVREGETGSNAGATGQEDDYYQSSLCGKLFLAPRDPYATDL